MRKILLTSFWLLIGGFSILAAQDLSLRLESERPTLLEGESGIFTFILTNETEVDAFDMQVAFTLNRDFQIVEESISTTHGSFESGWSIDTLSAGTSDTLSFEASSSGYAQFIAEVVSDNNLLISRCFSGDCYPQDNIKCFYTNCTPETDEVLYPTERFEVSFQSVECFPEGPIGCAAKYNITFENSSNVASAPLHLFLRAFFGEAFYSQSGETLQLPSIPANSSLTWTADFGDCIEDRAFATVRSLQLGLTQSNSINLFAEGTQTAPVSAFDAITDVAYCQNTNTTDIAIRAESNGAILPNNTATYQVLVTNNGSETAESIQITYGKNIFSFDGDIISYSGSSDYAASSLSEDEESRGRFLDYDKYWTIRDLAPGETAVLNVTVTVEEFVGIFTATIFLNDNSFLNDTNTDNNRTSISFERINPIDLELNMESPEFPFPRYTPNTVMLTLQNNGTEIATGVEVALDLSDKTQAVLVGEFDAIVSDGIFKPVPKLWQIDSLAAGATATLEVQYFPLVENYVPFAQVTAADQVDIDSTPNNGVCCTPNEDDEAALNSPSPYRLIGNAVQLDSNTYQLTSATNGQSGAIWNENLVDLTKDFLLDAALFLGTNDGGADGMAFIFQPICENIGKRRGGEFIGYGGITPSLVIEFDTYQNGYDPSSDHVAILKNGNGNHFTAEAFGEPILVNNLEDGAFHPISILWDADAQELTVILDGQTIFSENIGDIVNDIFLGDELVFWGFTAATGGLNNEHTVRIEEVVAEETNANCSTANNTCSFFRQYPNAFEGSNPNALELTETEDAFVLTAQFPEEERTLTLDKSGALIESNTTALEVTPVIRIGAVDSQLILLQTDADGDTLLYERIEVDYPNPTAIVPNNTAIRLSDGYLIGGFIVDTESAQMFRAFFVKTDLNGQSPQTVLIEDLNNTFFMADVLEDSAGGIYIFWSVAGNFSLSCTRPDLSTSWVRSFAGDTPSTTVADIVLSADESIIYVALTDNLRGKVEAYNTTDGSDNAIGFTLFELLPEEQAPDLQRMNGLLPLEDGSLLFVHRYFDRFSSGEGFQYGLVNPDGSLAWLERVEGAALDIRPIAQVMDGFVLATLSNDLTVLKTDANGERIFDCENIQLVEQRTEEVLEEGKVRTTLKLYPNPTSDILNYQIGDNSSIERVELYDLQGRQMLLDLSVEGQLSLETVSSGMYILLVHTKEGLHRQMIVKE